MKQLILSVFLFNLSAFSCEIIFQDNFVFTNSSKMSGVIKDSNCTTSINKSVLDIFKDLRGKVNIDFVKNEYLKDKDITLSPRLINIKSFSEFFKSRIEISENQKTFNETLIGRDSLSWDHEKTVSFNCSNCQNNGKKQVSIKIINYIENTEEVVWAKFNLLEKVKILAPKSNSIKAFTTINVNNIEEKYSYVTNADHYFDNKLILKFYKSTKSIKPGVAIKVSDVTKRALVKPGMMVNVILNGNGIKIKRRAKSMSYGYFGDNIKLLTTKRKEIFGVASNDNEVTVDL
jgi:flagella basal body P-ring formation protein FlgA